MWNFKLVQYTNSNNETKFHAFAPNMREWDWAVISWNLLKDKGEIKEIVATFNITYKNKKYATN